MVADAVTVGAADDDCGCRCCWLLLVAGVVVLPLVAVPRCLHRLRSCHEFGSSTVVVAVIAVGVVPVVVALIAVVVGCGLWVWLLLLLLLLLLWLPTLQVNVIIIGVKATAT